MKLEEKDVSWKAVRSSGPGGQNVNKRSTKVQMWVRVADLPLDSNVKKKIREKLANHIDSDDELQVECEEERFQEKNREVALGKLNNLIEEALDEDPKRIPTKPHKWAEEERLRHKHARYQKKKSRREGKNPDIEEIED